jgi:RNA polymerase sigma factor (sigma-70 family)
MVSPVGPMGGKPQPFDSAELAGLDEAVENQYSQLQSGYHSPLIEQISANRLTLELLQEHIPVIKAGEEASRLLDVPSASRGEQRIEELHQLRRQGARSKEILFAAALPLIRMLASKEWRRRKQWGSPILMEDLVQEASVGFMKGLAAFRMDAMKSSPTNYLGQWMLVEMRRSSENIDNDMHVGHDAGERFRKIRALRSRLLVELGREPTDAEIADASSNPEYLTRPSYLGRVAESGAHPIRGLSEEQVADAKRAHNQVGFFARLDSDTDETHHHSHIATVAPDRVVAADTPTQSSSHNSDPADIVATAAAVHTMVDLLTEAVARMRVGGEQRDIIARRYQLPPYDDQCSVREIARRTGVHRERVTRILNAFTYELTTPGGHFHALCHSMPPGTLESMEYPWIADTLGEWPSDIPLTNPRTPSRILTEERTKKTN